MRIAKESGFLVVMLTMYRSRDLSPLLNPEAAYSNAIQLFSRLICKV